MKKCLALSIFLSCHINDSFSQIKISGTGRDTLLRIEADPVKNFNYPYFLFIPAGTPLETKTYLLVEPNNSGFVNDTLEIHESAAKHTAAKNSVGNFIARELRLPLLVPVFPRAETEWKTYTHAFDRDAALIDTGPLKRLDLQLIAMIADAGTHLTKAGIVLNKKVLLNGFSASGTFVNRFSILHPEMVAATASGGINAIPMLPVKTFKDMDLNYPLGINDFTTLFGKKPNLKKYKSIPQFIYMGENDTNDAVLFDDGYDDADRVKVFAVLGKVMIPNRWETVKSVYKNTGVNAIFTLYQNMGHGTNGKINREIAGFFRNIIDQKAN